MMTFAFNKFQGTGNDFIIIDNRKGGFNATDSKLIKKLCDRRFGIGADGLILIGNSCGLDYEMRYFNSDGNESTMCGNGGRCAAAFSLRHGIATPSQRFLAPDGIHRAEVTELSVKLKMNEVTGIEIKDGNYFINTGSPHYVIFTDNNSAINVQEEGSRIRWSDTFAPGGTNVNFVETDSNGIFVRTFERGVEDETLSCGTGVTASAIASVISGLIDTPPVSVRTKGGNLSVDFERADSVIKEIWLTGPAEFVFDGKIEC
jgi:diaminopimelate epimerase